MKKKDVKTRKNSSKKADEVFADSNKRARKRRLQNDLRNVKCYSSKDWERLINRFFQMTFSELQDYLDPQRRRAKTAAELVIASIVVHTISKGDHYRLDFLLNRTIGKCKEKLELTTPEPFIIEKIGGGEVHIGSKQKENDEFEGETIDAVYSSGDRKQLEG